ncbi:hypothetical protein [Nitrosopumilus sp.]|uniref:hypothetical protein n=1 Tax=Nitrosopumilus sp. TaxID=2024843 RepID=UPI003D0FA488
MKAKLTTIIASLTIASLLFSVYQPGNAITYYNGHNGSVEEYITKTKVEPYKGKQGYWVYLVKVCADDYNLGVAAVILKSDIAKKELGVNKSIKKGECSHYGAVMKAKDGNTLGAELIERHEALEKYNEILNKMSGKSIKEKKELRKELYAYRTMLGGLV